MNRTLTKSALAAALCLALVFASCSSEPDLVMPNPGFGILSTGLELGGFRHILWGAQTSGHIPRTPITNQLIYPPGATGTVSTFNVTANGSGKAIVPGGIAPAFWTVTAGPGWNFWPIRPMSIFETRRERICTGKVAFVQLDPQEWNDLTCHELVGMVGRSPFGSSMINVSEPATEVGAAGGGVTSTYGMPIFQFYDSYGTYVAQTTATSIDTEHGLWAKGWTDCLAGLPTGTYHIDLINATADGVGERVGGAEVYLYGASSANNIDDHRFFVAQQYRDLLGREPDQAGLDAWSGVITQCSSPSYRLANETYASCVIRQRVNVAHGFWYSGEFAQRHPTVVGAGGFNNSEFARLCHALYLLKDPTQADQNFWTAQLDGTGDYDTVLKAFIYMDEYRARFEPQPGPVCDPSWDEINSCQQQGGSWDYGGCWCNPNGGILY